VVEIYESFNNRQSIVMLKFFQKKAYGIATSNKKKFGMKQVY